MDRGFISLFLLLILSIYIYFKPSRESYRNYTLFGSNILEDGYYVIRGVKNQKYCSDSPNGIVCDEELAGPYETFLLQNLGNGQYALRSVKRGLWCSKTYNGVYCSSPTIGDHEVFNIRHLGQGRYSIQYDYNKAYCVPSGSGMMCDVPSVYSSDFQLFNFIKVDWDTVK